MSASDGRGPLQVERRAQLLDELQRQGTVRVSDLTERLGVAAVTIRRDIAQMAAEGLVRRVHGGVTLILPDETGGEESAYATTHAVGAGPRTLGMLVPSLDYYWPGVVRGAEEAAQPNVFIFGAGHVGHALAQALTLLPVKVTVIDTRADELQGLPAGVAAKATAMPEALVRQAPQGTAHVIVTHDHALDFLIAQEALSRDDAPYVGMIGSRTKRAKFVHWFKAEGGDPQILNRLVMPIGQLGGSGEKGSGDKRPEVIAALAAAEIMVHIGRREVDLRARPVTGGEVDTVDGR